MPPTESTYSGIVSLRSPRVFSARFSGDYLWFVRPRELAQIEVESHAEKPALAVLFDLYSYSVLRRRPLGAYPSNFLRTLSDLPHYPNMDMNHIPDHDLERYYLGMVTKEPELARVQEHLLWCEECIDRCEATEQYVDAMRRAVINDNCGIIRGKHYPKMVDS